MAKIDALRRFLLPCFTPTTAKKPIIITSTKKRISTSLRDDIPDEKPVKEPSLNQIQEFDGDEDEDLNESSVTVNNPSIPARPSKTMVIGTIFGHRKGHVWFCIQHDRRNTKPSLLIELSISTSQLVKEMKCGLVRIALECDKSEHSSCHLHSVPVWTMSCNGRKMGFAARRKANEEIRLMLKTMQNTTVGAGVIPGPGCETEEMVYMRANYECMVGSSDSKSFHLINMDECPGQEFSLFLIRSN